jgi:hypothetical protein
MRPGQLSSIEKDIPNEFEQIEIAFMAFDVGFWHKADVRDARK